MVMSINSGAVKIATNPALKIKMATKLPALGESGATGIIEGTSSPASGLSTAGQENLSNLNKVSILNKSSTKADVSDLASKGMSLPFGEERDATFKEIVAKKSDLPLKNQTIELDKLKKINRMVQLESGSINNQKKELLAANPSFEEFLGLPEEINTLEFFADTEEEQKRVTEKEERLEELRNDKEILALNEEYEALKKKNNLVLSFLSKEKQEINNKLGVVGTLNTIDLIARTEKFKLSMLQNGYGLEKKGPAVPEGTYTAEQAQSYLARTSGAFPAGMVATENADGSYTVVNAPITLGEE